MTLPDNTSPETVIDNALILDSLPRLIGAIDQTLLDVSGQRQPFVLIVFSKGVGMHATNMNPPADALKAVKALALNWDDGDVAG